MSAHGLSASERDAIVDGLVRLMRSVPEGLQDRLDEAARTRTRLIKLAGLQDGSSADDALDALTSEVEALRRTSESLERERGKLQAEVARLRTRKLQAFEERNRVVVTLAHVARALGWRAGIGKHVDVPGQQWDPTWRTLVTVDLPVGQASWHVHDSHVFLLEGLPEYDGVWDGHSTEVKYNRLARVTDIVRDICRGGRLNALNTLARHAIAWAREAETHRILATDLSAWMQMGGAAPASAIERTRSRLWESAAALVEAEARLDRSARAIG